MYFGYEKDNEFVGLRKAWDCEAGVNTCNYGTTAVKDCVSVGAGTRCPSLTPGVSVVRMQGRTTLNVHSTEVATGSDAKIQLYHQTWNTKARPWYTAAAAATADAAGNYPDVWTDPYVFSGGVIGVTVARPVYDGATLLGVLAADYELTFLKTFINSIALGSGQQVFMVTTDSTLLATSDATVSVTSAGATRKTNDVGGLIKDAAAAIFAAQSSFSSKTASWSTLGSTITTGTFNSGGVSHKFDAIGVNDPRWIVVIAEKAQDLYVVDKDPKLLCALDTTCRNVLLSANYDLRERSVRHFSSRVKTYLGTALAAVLTLDTSFNMGNLHNGWCTTCGKLDWTNDVERKNVRRHVKDVLGTYAEVSWLYLGFYDTTDTTKGMIAGYRRSGAALDAWMTCDAATEECSQSGSSNFFSEAADGSLTFKEAYNGNFYDQNWFKYGASLNLQYDQVRRLSFIHTHAHTHHTGRVDGPVRLRRRRRRHHPRPQGVRRRLQVQLRRRHGRLGSRLHAELPRHLHQRLRRSGHHHRLRHGPERTPHRHQPEPGRHVGQLASVGRDVPEREGEAGIRVDLPNQGPDHGHVRALRAVARQDALRGCHPHHGHRLGRQAHLRLGPRHGDARD